MAYTFETHITGIVTHSADAAEQALPTRLYALIDAAQLKAFDKSVKRRTLLSTMPSEVLFKDSFAQGAIELSPLLFTLSDDNEQAIKQLSLLDDICQSRPVLAVLKSSLNLTQLVQHLRDVLLINADGTKYLLRYTDHQLLSGINQVFNPSQRAAFYNGIQAWFCVNYQGELDNMIDQSLYPQAEQAEILPLNFDETQTNALLTAVGIPILATQLCQLEPSFAKALTYAEQIGFVSEQSMIAKQEWIMDEDMTSWLIAQWQQHNKGKLV